MPFLLDCGSRSSRLYFCAASAAAQGAAASLPRLHVLGPELTTLHEAIARPGGLESFLGALLAAAASEAPPSAAVAVATPEAFFCGATGGMRDALAVGTVTDNDLTAFAARLGVAFPGAVYSTLDGPTEAALEFRSVAFAVEAAGLVDRGSRLAMLSLGGASLQLSDATSFASLGVGVRQTGAAGGSAGGAVEFVQVLRDHDSLASAVSEWSDRLRRVMAEGAGAMPLRDPHTRDLVVGISTAFWAAADCGVAGRVVGHGEVSEAAARRVDHLLQAETFAESLAQARAAARCCWACCYGRACAGYAYPSLVAESRGAGALRACVCAGWGPCTLSSPITVVYASAGNRCERAAALLRGAALSSGCAAVPPRHSL